MGQGRQTLSREPSQVEIDRELGSVCASPQFVKAERMCAFLRFIVIRSREGALDRLKEAVIGIEVFGREPGYDPKADPIVRTEARRLRQRLQEYYDGPGTAQPMRIDVPKGAYVACFELRPPEERRTWPARKKYLVLAGLILALSATAISRRMMPVWLIGRPQSPPLVRNLTSFQGDEESPTFSPDGTQVAFSWNGEREDNTDIYLMLAAGGPTRRLTTAAEADVHPVWSPDGTQIAFIRGWRDVMLISPLGGTERKIAEANYYFMSWAPDSSTLSISRREASPAPYSIYALAIASGHMQQITFPPANSVGDLYGAYSPDGRWLASVRCLVASCDLYVTPAEGGSSRRITNDHAWIRGVAWNLDGRELIYASDRRGFYNLWRVSVTSAAEPQQVAGTGDDEYYPAISRRPDGQFRLAYEHHLLDTNIWEIDRLKPQSAPRPILSSTRIDSSPQFSPDGRKLAFVSDRTGRLEIWTADSSGSDAAQLTYLRSEECGSPHWSPDGKTIVFDALTEDGRTIYTVPENGGTPRRLISGQNLGRPTWSRDGRWIYFHDAPQRTGVQDVWKIASDSGGTAQREPIRVTTGGGKEAVESVDGRTLYYIRDTDLINMPASGGVQSVVLRGAVHDGWWAPTGEGIYFVDVYAGKPSGQAAPRDARAVRFFNFQTRKTLEIGAIRAPLFLPRPDFCVSPDGRYILYGEVDVSNVDIRILDGFR